MLTALNHLTLAVTDLPRSLDFYTQVLGCRLRALGWGVSDAGQSVDLPVTGCAARVRQQPA
jgi:catechol 2,3-dioxygenase-like lactoylglutathione lyase family enzyme